MSQNLSSALLKELLQDIQAFFPINFLNTLPSDRFLLNINSNLYRFDKVLNAFIQIEARLNFLRQFNEYIAVKSKIKKEEVKQTNRELSELIGQSIMALNFSLDVAANRTEEAERLYKELLAMIFLPVVKQDVVISSLLSPIAVNEPMAFELLMDQIDTMHFNAFETYKTNHVAEWTPIQVAKENHVGLTLGMIFCGHTLEQGEKEKEWRCNTVGCSSSIKSGGLVYEKIVWHARICPLNAVNPLYVMFPIEIYRGWFIHKCTKHSILFE